MSISVSWTVASALSKDHAALAIYAALFLRRWLTAAALDTFCGDGSLLGVHSEHALPGVNFSGGHVVPNRSHRQNVRLTQA